ncbi:erythritol transport system ATP-binding protein [Bryocella elongata]|uniref:Erythritol transport system ATP-binding protein n=1 Tax=Bryocella elongata TaxID=863522 RepID=A0A1H6AX42_9BACT|nr:sugar ABC transporter ATP-binding protein [Bryocella elongata]SEG53219.1 erythritol transport system ATP-binding protein [Bryocella elongata]
MSNASDILLEARNITKRYPGQLALDDVTFRVYRGRVNVLIGENGAGKSTLMRILCGAESHDEGEIWMDAQLLTLGSPRAAAAHGIAIVHQELSVFANLDVSENIFAGREMVSMGMVNRRAEDERSLSALTRLRKPLEASTLASELSLGCRQVLEIARALAHQSRLLILDEPTSALSQAEAETLFEAIGDLLAAGLTIIYISHRLGELMRLGDAFTVLRSGKVVGTAMRGEATREWIVTTMSGRPMHVKTERRRVADATRMLEVRDLTVGRGLDGGSAEPVLDRISLSVCRGEIVGIFGLLGAGRTELLETLAGSAPGFTGDIAVDGHRARLRSVSDAMDAGIALVPEDRQRDGLVPELSVRENIVLALQGERWLSRTKETERVMELVRKLRIEVRDIELPVTALSGGNQQKVLLARCLARKPRVLLLDEPTRGVDANAKAEIYRVLRELADEGLSVLFTSSEIEETEELADRALVMREGRIVAELGPGEMTDVALMNAASHDVAASRIDRRMLTT